jgi:hypothetical protein
LSAEKIDIATAEAALRALFAKKDISMYRRVEHGTKAEPPSEILIGTTKSGYEVTELKSPANFTVSETEDHKLIATLTEGSHFGARISEILHGIPGCPVTDHPRIRKFYVTPAVMEALDKKLLNKENPVINKQTPSGNKVAIVAASPDVPPEPVRNVEAPEMEKTISDAFGSEFKVKIENSVCEFRHKDDMKLSEKEQNILGKVNNNFSDIRFNEKEFKIFYSGFDKFYGALGSAKIAAEMEDGVSNAFGREFKVQIDSERCKFARADDAELSEEEFSILGEVKAKGIDIFFAERKEFKIFYSDSKTFISALSEVVAKSAQGRFAAKIAEEPGQNFAGAGELIGVPQKFEGLKKTVASAPIADIIKPMAEVNTNAVKLGEGNWMENLALNQGGRTR